MAKRKGQAAPAVSGPINTAKLWALTRLGLGWIFFWGFIDKLFGLGFTTKPEAAWLAGGSPTTGFLHFATTGPLAGLFQAMAGNILVDVLFMLGLLLIGIALMSGIAVRFAGYMGALLMILMYLAAMPPEHNPIVDDHLIYALVLLIMGKLNVGKHYGLANWWSNTGIAKKFPILK